MAWFRTLMHQEPIVMISCIIGGIGLAMPLVVPPIREAMGYGAPTPKAPPPVRKVSRRFCRACVSGLECTVPAAGS